MRLAILFCTIFFGQINPSSACGTVEWAIKGIYGIGPMNYLSSEELFSSLAKVGGPCQQLTDLNPIENQKQLTNLLLDNQFGRQLAIYGQEIFIGFRCLNTQKKNPNYQKLTQRYVTKDCPEGNNLFVTTRNGGNLRSSPETADNKLTSLPSATELKELSRDGEWIEVEVVRYNPYSNTQCKYRTPCKTGFIHQSIVE